MNEVDQLAVVVREGDATTNGNSRNSGDLEEPLFPLTDSGNGERFAAQHGKNVRYIHQWGRFHIWDGRRWAGDDTAAVERLAKRTARSIKNEANRITDIDRQTATRKHAHLSESGARLREMIGRARSENPIAARTDLFDRDPMLLTVENGTMDLCTGTLREHRREDFISRACAVPYLSDMPTPVWDAALERWTGGNQSLEAFLQRAVGASITGYTSDEVFFFLFGPGRNGKSKFIKAIRYVLGDYAKNIRPEALMVTQGGGIPNELASLVGIRFVSTAEVEEGSRMAESLVKQLTGGDAISVRFLRAEFFELEPVLTLWMAGNHKPNVRGTDAAIWERILTIPFTVTIPPAERDPQLSQKLEKEAPGILAWAVQGCLDWQKHGLKPPAAVLEATKEYRGEMDLLGQFLEDCCNEQYNAVVPSGKLYERYRDWAKANGQKEWNQQLFGRKVHERGFEPTRNGGLRVWEGLDIKPLTSADL